ncbi:MAG TPA: DUF4232 domain-containing protein [Nocardioides sp.]|nr:DUF4232 domain-containing protein [Nocardioides sp.]
MNTKITLAAAGLVAASALLVPAAAHAGGSVPVVPQCRNADLHASYHYDSSGMSHTYWNLTLKNVSDHACRTGGFGGLSFVGHGDGTQVGAAADREGTSRSYVVLPGRRLISQVSQTSTGPYDRSYCRPVHVDGFRVYVPNATRSQFIARSGTACANTAVHLLSHTAYQRP